MAWCTTNFYAVCFTLYIFVGIVSVSSGDKLSELLSRVPEIPKSPWRMHTLFSVECRDYFDWQTIGLTHSFKKTGQPGPITRLLSCTEEELKSYKGLDLTHTHTVPSMSHHPVTGDWYPAINKPAGVVHWLNHSKEAKNVDWVVILDADMIMRHPITPWEVGAEKGKPVSASYGYLIGCDNELGILHTTHPEYCDKVGGFIVMHIDDLRAMAPLWLSKTEEVRQDTAHWSSKYTGDIYERGWISEMYGYSFGAAEVGLRHKITDAVMIYPGYIPREGVEPFIMHYGLRFNVSSWYFDKADHMDDAIVYDCNRLFPAPPFPEEVELMTTENEERRALLLSIECINSINEGLLLNHEKRSCPKPVETEYLKFLRTGSDPTSRPRERRVADNVPHVSKSKLVDENVKQDNVAVIAAENTLSQHFSLHPRIHTLFSTECNDYFDWQTLGLYHSFQLSGQPGFITRLLSCTDEKLKTYKNMDLAPTHVVPSMSVHPLTGDRYPAINKPAGVVHWLNHVKVDVEYVLILDADMILRGPITPWEFGASRGHPVSVAYDYLIGCDNILAQLHTRYPSFCQKVGGVILMHIDDLRLFAPLWLHKTEEVRADKAHWATNITGDVYGHGWISEMYGYSFGAAELKLKHIINSDIMLYPGYVPPAGVEVRVLHYGLNFKVGNWSWDKHKWHYTDMTSECWSQFPSPPDPSTMRWLSTQEERKDRLSIECMKTLNEAIFLYHKRRGCKVRSGTEGIQNHVPAQLDEGKSQVERRMEEGIFNKGHDKLVKQGASDEDDSDLENLSEERLTKRSMLSNLRSNLVIRSPRYWMITVWSILVVLFLFAVSAIYSSRRRQPPIKYSKVKFRRADLESKRDMGVDHDFYSRPMDQRCLLGKCDEENP